MHGAHAIGDGLHIMYCVMMHAQVQWGARGPVKGAPTGVWIGWGGGGVVKQQSVSYEVDSHDKVVDSINILNRSQN